MSTRNIVKNIRSSAVIDGKPKLPTSNQLDFGEIAINYAEDHETLSFKNNSNEIVSLSVKTVDDVKVNGNSVVSNKTANITMKGNTIPVSGNQYDVTNYPSPFEDKAAHISATDKVDAALKILETNISALVTEVLDDEETFAAAIRKLANSAGTVDGSNNIMYIKATNAHYINNAESVHDATVKLDNEIYSLETRINESVQYATVKLDSEIYGLETRIGESSGQNAILGLSLKLKMVITICGVQRHLIITMLVIGQMLRSTMGQRHLIVHISIPISQSGWIVATI